MRRVLTFLLIFSVLLIPMPAFAEEDAGAWALDVLDQLANGDFETVYENSDVAMQDALGSADGMASVWAQLTNMLGALEDTQVVETGEQSGYRLVSVQCAFANADALLALAFDAQGHLSSLGLTSMTARNTGDEADADGYIEEAVVLRAGQDDATNGLLTLPEGESPFPAVVMVHGSGASDLNETAYANAPFRDLAHGLARLGVASIRYDKYTYAHPEMCMDADFTVDDEYTRDAVEAAALLAGDARIGDIYLLGHSQGAMLGPRIMGAIREEVGDRLQGGVLLAGSPLPMWEIQYHQNLEVLSTLTGDVLEENRALVEAEVEKVDTLAGLSDAELQKQTLFGINAYYQMDEMRVDTVQTAVSIGLPLFIAQGGKDWQVRPVDGIEAWQEELPEEFDATYKLYQNMNHMLADLEGEMTGTAADYMDADAHVSETLIGDIAAWINER